MKRVLLAEDDADLRDLADLLLSLGGCDVTAVADGGEAATVIAAGSRFDVLVLDHDMPVLTGLQVAERARAAGHGGPIILWTAWTGAVTQDEVGRHGLRLLPKHEAAGLVALVRDGDDASLP